MIFLYRIIMLIFAAEQLFRITNAYIRSGRIANPAERIANPAERHPAERRPNGGCYFSTLRDLALLVLM